MESEEGPSTAFTTAAEGVSPSAADLSSCPPVVESPPLSLEETVGVDLPHFSPSDDDLERERNSGEDHGDHPVDAGILTDDLKQKIIRQVEYYFSDENLPTDKYLLNAMKRNKGGYVPISTIATFHKMKKLTRDIASIVSALKESSFLVISSDGKKVKRLNPLREIKDPKLFTVLVENLPEDHSEENIRKIFGEAGNIKSVSICDPNAVKESEKGAKKEKFMSTRLHALVEYQTVEAAEKAAATLNNEQDWRNGLRVKLLEQAGKYGQRRQGRREGETEKNSTDHRAHEHATGDENRKAGEHHHHRHHHSDVHDEDDKGHHHKDKTGHKGRGRGRTRRQNYQHGSNSTGAGHGAAQSSSMSTHHPPAEPSKPLPGPRMPDGTRGFTMGRGRPLTLSSEPPSHKDEV